MYECACAHSNKEDRINIHGDEATGPGNETEGGVGSTTVEGESEATCAGIRTGVGVGSTTIEGKSEASPDRLLLGVFRIVLGDKCRCRNPSHWNHTHTQLLRRDGVITGNGGARVWG